MSDITWVTFRSSSPCQSMPSWVSVNRQNQVFCSISSRKFEITKSNGMWEHPQIIQNSPIVGEHLPLNVTLRNNDKEYVNGIEAPLQTSGAYRTTAAAWWLIKTKKTSCKNYKKALVLTFYFSLPVNGMFFSCETCRYARLEFILISVQSRHIYKYIYLVRIIKSSYGAEFLNMIHNFNR